jgi:hypothetical protein
MTTSNTEHLGGFVGQRPETLKGANRCTTPLESSESYAKDEDSSSYGRIKP